MIWRILSGIYRADWGADPESIRAQVDEMLASDPQFRRTWDHERPDLADQSLSGYEQQIGAIRPVEVFADVARAV